MDGGKWGEIKETKKTVPCSPNVSEDIRKAKSQFCIAEFDTEYDQHNIERRTEKITIEPFDEHIMFAIDSHQFMNSFQNIDSKNMVSVLESMDSSQGDFKQPEYSPTLEKRMRRNVFNHSNSKETVQNKGDRSDTHVPELSSSVVKELLLKFVSTMTAHIGFETAEQSCLHVMADVLEAFLQKLGNHYTAALEDSVVHHNRFPAVEDRVLTELGLGGIRGIRDYYVNSVVRHSSVLKNRMDRMIVDARERAFAAPPPVELQHIKQEVKDEADNVVHIPDGNFVYPDEILAAFEAQSKWENI